MTGGAVLAAGSAALVAGTGGAAATGFGPVESVVAKAEISELRRLYGKATDGLGPGADHTGTGVDIRAVGREIYNRIFTPDANIIAGTLAGTGPDDWAEKMAAALATFTATQHMLGTQLVDITESPNFIAALGRRAKRQ